MDLKRSWQKIHPSTQPWKADSSLIPPLIALTYAQQDYMVTDEAAPASSDAAASPDADQGASSWNRDVFRLISQITAQVTVDISKFPLPQTLQLNVD